MQKVSEIDQHEAGAKLDHDKVDMSLLQCIPNALAEVCHVMDYGQTKYTRGGFLEVVDAVRRYTAAMWRHYFAEETLGKYDAGDPFYDTALGLRFKGTIRHDAQVAVNALFRLECRLREEMAESTDMPDMVTIPKGFFTAEGILDESRIDEVLANLKKGVDYCPPEETPVSRSAAHEKANLRMAELNTKT